MQFVLHARMQGDKCVWIGDELRGKVAVVRNGDGSTALHAPSLLLPLQELSPGLGFEPSVILL